MKGKRKRKFCFLFTFCSLCIKWRWSISEDMRLLPLMFLSSIFRERLFLFWDLSLCCLTAHGKSWLLYIRKQHVSKSVTLFMCNHSLVTWALCKHVYWNAWDAGELPALLSNPGNSWKTPNNSTISLVDRNFICRASTTPGWESLEM